MGNDFFFGALERLKQVVDLIWFLIEKALLQGLIIEVIVIEKILMAKFLID